MNRISDPVFYVFDYQHRPLTMEFQHFHDYYEMYVLLEDTAAHIIEGEYFHLQHNDLVLLKPRVLHKTVYPENEAPKARLIIAFKIPESPPGFEKQTKRMLSVFEEKIPIFRFTDELLQKLISLFNDIYLLGRQNLLGSDLMIHLKFQELLYLIESNRKANRFVRLGSTDSITEKIYTVTSYLHAHYSEELSLPELAELFSISPFYLSRQFSQVTGTSFVTYLQLIRVRDAQHQLLYSTKKIRDISEACGFTSFSQFNRVFHKFCGMSPTVFRRDENNQEPILLRTLDAERNSQATLPRILQSPQEQG